MVKGQTSFSQEVRLIQWIEMDCAYLWAVIQLSLFPLMFSVHSTTYLSHTIQSYFQDRFVHVRPAFL